MILSQGEIALLIDDGGLDTINAVAHEIGLVSMPVLRSEATAQEQEQTVIEHAARFLSSGWLMSLATRSGPGHATVGR